MNQPIPPSSPQPAPMQVTDDTLLDGRVKLRQPRDGYRVAIDPVLLAAAVPAASGEMVLDVGTGVGAAALCLAWRAPESRVVGLELQRSLGQLASRAARMMGPVSQKLTAQFFACARKKIETP